MRICESETIISQYRLKSKTITMTMAVIVMMF